MKKLCMFLIGIFMIAGGTPAFAKDDVGSVVAVRGKAVIERDRKSADAKVKDSVYLQDTITTSEASRAKVLFIDESVLTLGEKARMVVKEFVYSKEKGGKSVFNLLDGKMRSVVGKAGFEVHTATAVAAARGTVILFDTGVKDGKAYTTIVCTEGTVIITLPPPATGSITLTAGMMITIVEGEPIPVPVPVPANVTNGLLNDTDISGHEISIPGPMQIDIGIGRFDIGAGASGVPGSSPPPINQQPPQATTPVNINLTFPQ